MNAVLSKRSGSALARRLLAVLVATAMPVVWSASAYAEGPTDYCQKVTARAEADAALLMAPTAHVQLIRYPNNGAADPSGFQLGHGLQPRAALSIGFVDIYKGFGVLDAAKAECGRQASASSLEEVVAQRADIGRLPALERKLAFLREQSAAVQELVRNAEERFAAHTTTLSEVQDIRIKALSFAGRTAETETEIALIKARGFTMPTAPIGDVLKSYEERTVELENRVAHVRNLEPWKFGVIGGVAANPTVDAYGIAELSYNFGGLFSVGAERRAVDARAAELKNARYEMRKQVEIIIRELRISAEQSRRQARALEEELVKMSRERAALDGTEAPNKHTVLATMTMQMIELEAEQRFLVALAAAQSSFGGAK
jgi:hypothetical protein